MSEHDEMQQAVASYALGALPQAEAGALLEHLRTCRTCAAEYRDAQRAVTALAYSAEACATGEDGPVASPLLKMRVMSAVTGSARKPQRSARGASIIAAVCAAAAVTVLLYDFSLRDNLRRERAAVAAQRAAIADLTAPQAHRYAFSGGDVYVSDHRIYVSVRRLAALPKGRVYQLWTLARGERQVRPSITFTQTRNALLAIPHPPKATAAVAISVEPEGGSLRPTAKPVVVVHLGG